jgi:hypothetical protein
LASISDAAEFMYSWIFSTVIADLGKMGDDA